MRHPSPNLFVQLSALEASPVYLLTRLTIRGYVRSGEKKDIPMQTRPIEQANEAVADLRAGKIIGRCVLTHAPREPSM